MHFHRQLFIALFFFFGGSSVFDCLDSSLGGSEREDVLVVELGRDKGEREVREDRGGKVAEEKDGRRGRRKEKEGLFSVRVFRLR